MVQVERLGIARVKSWCKVARVNIEFIGEITYPSKRSDIASVVRDTYIIGNRGLRLIVNPNNDYQLMSNSLLILRTYSQGMLIKELSRLKATGKFA